MAVECSLARQRVVARPIADNLATNQLKHRSPLYTTVNIDVGLWSQETITHEVYLKYTRTVL